MIETLSESQIGIFLGLIFLASSGVASPCPDWPIDLEGQDLVLDGHSELCASGYHRISTLLIPENATVRLAPGAHSTWLSADIVDLRGTIDFRGQGLPGGNGCSREMRAAGEKGAGEGGGSGGQAHDKTGGGGGGAGGSGHHWGGKGGDGSGGAPGGSASRFTGLGKLAEIVPASGGGGGACGAGLSDRGGAGGAGGGSIGLRGAVLRIHPSARILVDGADGESAPSASGGGGGGGAAGRIFIYPEEQLFLDGQLSAKGGKGGDGGWAELGSRSGGGGGGGSGGVVEFWYMDCPPGWMDSHEGSYDIAPGDGGRRPSTEVYGGRGVTGWSGCVEAAATQPAPLMRASPSSTVEGTAVNIEFTSLWSTTNTEITFDCGDGVIRQPEHQVNQRTALIDCFYDDNRQSRPLVGIPGWPRWYPHIFVRFKNRVDWHDETGNIIAPAGSEELPFLLSYFLPVEVANVAPTVRIKGPTQLKEGETATFSLMIEDPSQADTDAGFEIVWDWGDNTDRAEFNVYEQSKTYQNSGDYIVSVEVMDKDRGLGIASHHLSVENVPPTVVLDGPKSPLLVGQAYQFTAKASDPSPADMAAGFSFVFDWGDGSSEQITANSSVELTKVFAKPGHFNVTVHATDADGAQSEPAELKVKLHQSGEESQDGVAVGGGCGCSSGSKSMQLLALLFLFLYWRGAGRVPLDS